MNINLVAFDDKHYASNVVQSEMTLKWDALGNTHNLIIRGEYGRDAWLTEAVGDELERIPADQLLSGNEISLTGDLFAALCPKGFANNYKITTCPAAYAVFCCEYDAAADACRIYVPNEACLYYCNVTSQIEVSVKRENAKKRLLPFGRKASPELCSVFIPQIPGYVDGNLCYTFEGYKYKFPIPKSMLGHAFKLPTYNGQVPLIETTVGNGYKITINY